jgi:hypothetical protein
VQTAEGKLFLFVGIDRTSKFAVAQLVATADRKTPWGLLQHMLEAVPYQVHPILTDNVLCREGLPLEASDHGASERPDAFGRVAQAGSAVEKWSLP